MTEPAEHVELITVPSYRLLTLRDQDNDADEGVDEAISQALTAVAASTGHELVISCAQDLLPVSATLEAWTAPPDGPDDPAWSTPQTFELEFASALLVLGSPTADAISLELPAGPGVYAVDVAHKGRDRALAARQDVLEHEDIISRKQELTDAHPGGFERYRIRAWPANPC
ncbi:hypothetical protein JNUCC0626_04120 [Lentzea sp. JNUCC 0626]|uniref:hypothetical protein n=1 Tax=Lentzea sp. JNUCC 0626 TaxID=3367513 RepID=UPI0037482F8E